MRRFMDFLNVGVGIGVVQADDFPWDFLDGGVALVPGVGLVVLVVPGVLGAVAAVKGRHYAVFEVLEKLRAKVATDFGAEVAIIKDRERRALLRAGVTAQYLSCLDCQNCRLIHHL